MDTTWKVTEADRDEAGKIRVGDEPRSLADLLPKVGEQPAETPAHKFTRRELLGLGAASLLCLLIIGYAWGGGLTEPVSAPVAQPTTAPATATALPTAEPATSPPTRLLAAFDAPDGRTLGSIEETRPYTPTARYGDDWVQVEAAGSGSIWLRAVDLDVSIAGLPDLAPRPTAAPRPAAPAPAQQAEPPAAPAVCDEATAPYKVSRQVRVGTLPIGTVARWSCTSAADAEAQAQAAEAEMRAAYTPADTPTAVDVTPLRAVPGGVVR